MSGDPFSKISAGDPYPRSASFRNAVADMLKWWRNQGGARGLGRKQVFQQATIVDVKNTTPSTKDRFAALAIDDVFPDPVDNATSFANGPVLHGITPSDSTEPGNFAVLLSPATAGAIVPACVAGVCVAKVYINDTNHKTCGVMSTSTVLQSGEQGAQILWKASGTGEKWAVIRIGYSESSAPRLMEATGRLTHDDTTNEYTVACKPVILIEDGGVETDEDQYRVNTDADEETAYWMCAPYIEDYEAGPPVVNPEPREFVGTFIPRDRFFTQTVLGVQQIISPPPHGILFENMSGETIPAYAAIRITVDTEDYYRQHCYRAYKPLGPQYDRVILLNGPWDVPSYGEGRAFTATEHPHYFLLPDKSSYGVFDAYLGQAYGTAPGSWALWPGLPGFRVAAPGGNDTDDSCPQAVRDWSGPYWGQAIADAYTADYVAYGHPPYVDIHPARQFDGNGLAENWVYDGSTAAKPSITLRVTLPVHMRQGTPTTSARLEKWPNVFEHDHIQYVVQHKPTTGATNATNILIGVGDLFDECPGTIKLWSGSVATIPRGWALCDGTANNYTVGGSGIDLRGRFIVGVETRTGGAIPAHSDAAYTVGATGGNKTHTHPGGSSFGGAGTTPPSSYGAADHRDPWFAICYIERVRLP